MRHVTGVFGANEGNHVLDFGPFHTFKIRDADNLWMQTENKITPLDTRYMAGTQVDAVSGNEIDDVPGSEVDDVPGTQVDDVPGGEVDDVPGSEVDDVSFDDVPG